MRLALFPLRPAADRTGYVDLSRGLGRRKLLAGDVNTIRATNNAIFDDIFWAGAVDAGDPDQGGGVGQFPARFLMIRVV